MGFITLIKDRRSSNGTSETLWSAIKSSNNQDHNNGIPKWIGECKEMNFAKISQLPEMFVQRIR